MDFTISHAARRMPSTKQNKPTMCKRACNPGEESGVSTGIYRPMVEGRQWEAGRHAGFLFSAWQPTFLAKSSIIG